MHWGSPSYYRCLHCQQLAIFAETIRFATLLLVMESCSSLSQMPKQTETIKHWSVLLVIQYWHCWNPCDGPGCQFAKILPGGFLTTASLSNTRVVHTLPEHLVILGQGIIVRGFLADILWYPVLSVLTQGKCNSLWSSWVNGVRRETL